MIPQLMRARPFLPERFWRAVRDLYWRKFWKRETRAQQEQIGSDAPQLAGSERATLIEAIADRYPFKTALEIGSGFGQNGTILGPLFPRAEFTGIDPDFSSLEQGRRILSVQGINNVALVQAFAEDLSQFPSASFDLVFSCAALLYLGPDQIERAAGEMVRLCAPAGGGVVLMEQHHAGGDWAGRRIERAEAASGYGAPTGYWIRDYAELFKRAAPGKNVTVRSVANPVWSVEQWKSFAALIEVEV